MADSEDAGVEAMQAPACRAVRSAARAQPQGSQLSQAHDAVLAPRKAGEPRVEWRWPV